MTIQSNFSITDSSFGPRNAKNRTFSTSIIGPDTCVKRTLVSVPLVYVLKRFDCSNFQIMRAYSSEGNHGSRLCFTWIITSQWIFSQSQWKNLNDKLQHLFVQCHTTFEWCCILTMKPGQNIYGNNNIKFLPYSKTFMQKKTYITSDKHITSPNQNSLKSTLINGSKCRFLRWSLLRGSKKLYNSNYMYMYY